MVRGLTKKDVRADRRAFAQAARPYASIEDLWRRAHVPVASLHGIARADGFRGLGLSRREAAWAIKGLRDEAFRSLPRPMIAMALLRPKRIEPAVALTPMTMGREVVEDYRTKGLSLRAHPLGVPARKACRRAATCPARACATRRTAAAISIAGLVLVRQMPGSAKGVMFITLEDESATTPISSSGPRSSRRTGERSSAPPCLAAVGKVQRASGVIHLIVEHADRPHGGPENRLRPRHRIPARPRARRRSQAWRPRAR